MSEGASDGAARYVWRPYRGHDVSRQAGGWNLHVTPITGRVVTVGDRQLVQVGRDRFELLDERWHQSPGAATASVADEVEEIGRDLIRQAEWLRAGRG